VTEPSEPKKNHSPSSKFGPTPDQPTYDVPIQYRPPCFEERSALPNLHYLNQLLSQPKMFAVYPPIAASEARFLAATSRGNKKNRAAAETYDCKHCNRSFNKQYNLLIHERSHEKSENQTLFNCNICGKGFRSMNNMKNHRLSHSPKPIPKLKGFLVECVTY